MTARDQLADRIVPILDRDRLWPDAQETALAVADAVIGMVLPLEWEDWSGQHRAHFTAPTQFGRYSIGQFFFPETHFRIEPPYGMPVSAATLEAAKAAANRHHRAQILAALGLDAGEGQL